MQLKLVVVRRFAAGIADLKLVAVAWVKADSQSGRRGGKLNGRGGPVVVGVCGLRECHSEHGNYSENNQRTNGVGKIECHTYTSVLVLGNSGGLYTPGIRKQFAGLQRLTNLCKVAALYIITTLRGNLAV